MKRYTSNRSRPGARTLCAPAGAPMLVRRPAMPKEVAGAIVRLIDGSTLHKYILLGVPIGQRAMKRLAGNSVRSPSQGRRNATPARSHRWRHDSNFNKSLLKS